MNNVVFMRHRAGALTTADALAKEFPAGNKGGMGGADKTPITGTPAVVELTLAMSNDVRQLLLCAACMGWRAALLASLRHELAER